MSWVYFVALWVVGGVLSWIALRDSVLMRSLWFELTGLALLFVLAGFYGASAMEGVGDPAAAIFAVISILASIVPGVPFVAHVFADLFLRAVREMAGDSHLKVHPTYDKADAAVHHQDYARAERLYKKSAAEHPDDPVVHRRLATLYLCWDRPRNAVEELRHVYRLVPGTEDKYLVAFECAEILETRLRDLPAAIAEIEAALAEHPDHPAADFARERLTRLRERMDKETAPPTQDAPK